MGGRFGSGLALEPLEKRLVLTVSPSLAGIAPNYAVTFFDSNTGTVDNDLQLRFNGGTGDLEWSVNGGAFSNDLDSAGGTQNASFGDIATIDVRLELGNDSLQWGLQTFAFDVTVQTDTNDPLQTDILLDDTGSADSINASSSGANAITFDGSGSNDTLIVGPTDGDHQFRTENFDGNRDRVISDALPEIRFGDLDTFQISQAGVGTDVVTFATLNLLGADNYETDLFAFDTLVIEGADAVADRFTVDWTGTGVAVHDNVGGTTVTQLTSSLGLLQLNTLGGEDQVTVDIDGTSPVSTPIFYDGGDDADRLTVTGAPTTAVDEVIVTTGPALGSGALRYENAVNSRLMSIGFSNLEPVLDLVPAAILTVNATNADNAINYIEGPNSNLETYNFAITGLVSVDGHETTEFANKTNLVINALAGSDTTNLNNPVTPTGLTGITVNGGDPTASDTLIVNGTVQGDAITYGPGNYGSGSVSVTGFPDVDFETTEHLIINGQGGDDTLSISTFNIDGTQLLTPGVADDAGTVEFRDDSFGTESIATPLDFLGLGSGGTLVSTDTFPGLYDHFVYRGTELSDAFTATATAADETTVNLNGRIPVELRNMISITLAGLDGDDMFDLDADGIGFAPNDIVIDGGDPSASDTVNLSNPTGTVTVSLGDAALATDTTINGYGSTVTLSGVEVANVATDGEALTVNGNTTDEQIDYTPTGGQAGTFQTNGLNTLFNFSEVTDPFTIDPDANNDTVTVHGTNLHDVINLSQSAGTVTAEVSGLLGIEMPSANVEALFIAAGAGNDGLVVDSTTGPVTVPMYYDGEEGTNYLRLEGGQASQDHYTVGPEVGAGRSEMAFVGGVQVVNFSNLAPVLDLVASPVLTVNATGADNAINYTEGGAGTNGLVSVDSFESIEFSNKVELVINAMAGSDTININNPSTPTGLTSITINSSDPTASDTLIVNGTVGTDDIVYDPQDYGAGTVSVSGLPDVDFQTTEHLVINGQGGDDTLTISTGNTDGTQILTPAAADDAGTVEFRDGPGFGAFVATTVEFLGLGFGGTLVSTDTIAGLWDHFVYRGTELSDLFAATATAADETTVKLNDRIAVELHNMLSITLAGLDGDDTFDLDAVGIGFAPVNIFVDGGDPSASDTLSLSDPTGGVTVNLGDAALATDTTIDGYGGTVTLNGVEVANMATDDEALTVNGTSTDEQIDYTPTGTEAGTFQKSGLNTLFNFSEVIDPFTIDAGGGANQVTFHDTANDDGITATTSGTNTVVALGTFKPVVLPNADTQALLVAGSLGNDLLVVDSSSGPVLVPITYDGGADINSLFLTGGTATSDEYSVGAEVGSGTSVMEFPGGTQFVRFSNLAPVIDLVAGPLLVNATNADNAINYIEGPNSNTAPVGFDTTGLVSVDGFETIEFANKDTLLISAQAGSDTVNLNNPATPTGLLNIGVSGGDPTASDTLIVNSRPAVSETMRLVPNGVGAGTITNLLAVPTIDFTEIEDLTAVLQQSDLDAFVVDGTAGNDVFRVTSGPEIGQLHVEGTMNAGGPAFPLPSIDIHGQDLLGGVAFNSIPGGTDIFEVVGTGGNDTFDLSAGGGPVGVVTHNVNGVDVNSIAFANISTTTLDGRDGDDTFNVSGATPGVLPFDVNILGGNPSASDVVNLESPSAPVIVNLADAVLASDTTITGYGTGDVTLSGVEIANLDTDTLSLTVNGTSTDDEITYTPSGASAGAFQLAGLNTLFNFTNVVDPFTITGGIGGLADTVVIQGTNARDTFQIDQGARTAQVLANGAIALKLVNLANSIETLSASGLAGQDTFRVIPAPGIGGFPLDNLLIDVDGGAGGENNALVVEDSFGGATLPATTFVVVNRGSAPNSGTLRVFENAVANPDINYQNVQVVSPNVAVIGGDPNLLVMGPDENEPNEFQANATFLGSGASIEVAHAAIFPDSSEFPGVPADVDFYHIIAQVTGILDLRVLFRTFAAGLLPGNGELALQILDELGNVVGSVGVIPGGLGAVIPVVAGESYYVRVAGDSANVVNGYSLLAENFAAPVPTAVVLDPQDDSGQSNLDQVTLETTDVHFFIHADLASLAAQGISILTPAQANAADTPGVAVEVFVNGVSVGYATAIPGTDNTLFEIELNADLANFSVGGPNAAGPLGYPGFTNLITAAVRIFDVQEDGGGLPDPATARNLQSSPLRVIFDDTAPLAPIDFALLESSDSGVIGDELTNVNPPAFSGRGEANTLVRIYANGAMVGQGVVGSDESDGVTGDGLGIWEVTIEPVTDGTYTFTSELEDLAGNIGATSASLIVEIDTLAPQRPTIDLLDNYDTGTYYLDNVTYFQELQFRVSAEVGSLVFIKDGEQVIDSFIMPAAPFTIRTLVLADGPHPLSAEATDDALNRSAQSEELLVTVDSVPPDPPSTPELLDASDSGVMGDGITNVNPPAFKGTGEANAIVRIFATIVGDDNEPELVGIGRVGSDLTEPPEDLPDEPPIGAWEVTIEPLADGIYDITAELEDLAGNISDMSGEFRLEIDTTPPQRPTIDLINAFDTGMSDLDNVTYLSTLDFLVSAEPGTDVVIKDGNTVVDMFVMPAVPFTIRTLDFVFLEGVNGIPADGPHPLSAEATDEADNRSHQSEELLAEIDLTNPDPASVPDLLASSDSGKFDDDDVTNIQALAFAGTGEANAKVRIFANGLLVGQGVVGSDLTDPPPELPEDPPAFGEWEITTEPLDSGTWTITVEIEDLAGRITVTEGSLTVYVDAVLPNKPYLDLRQDSDTGRNNQDNVTNDNTPTVTSTIDDVQGAAANSFPHDVIYRIYDRTGTGPDTLLVDSFTTIGFSTNKFFTDVLPVLADGVHNLKLEAEDRAGNINDFLLEITIDTVAPPVFFGLSAVANDGLDPDSDSGVEGVPDTFTDRITNVTRPTFWGSAEANALVRLFNTDFGGAVIFGEDQAIPLDGNFAFPDGRWSIWSTIDMNDPAFFSFDGLRQMAVTAEDLAGNESELETLDIFIDTQGPQITNVSITDDPGYNLFGLKPDNQSQGPTPLIFSLTIDLWDLPREDALFLRDAIEAGVASTPGLITLMGDHNGLISIDNIIVTNDPPVAGQVATASIELVFNEPLPDDRFTLTVHDDIVDIAGNNLDGENNAIEPNNTPNFPTGDGQPGGDFMARFTVDSRPEVGSYAATSIYIDINGNLLYDPQGVNNDETNRDLTFNLGIVPSLEGTVSPFNVHDGLFAGNFPGENVDRGEDNEVVVAAAGLFADGFDKLAAYGFDNLIGKFRWLIDTNSDGIIDPAAGDHATIQPAGYQINGLPVAGNFDGDDSNGDEIGLFDGTKWYFDTNHDYIINGSDPVFTTSLRGTPIVGDFNGDGVEDLGTWRNDQFTFDFGSGSPPSWNGAVEATINWGLPGTADKPVAADMDADGIDDIGLWLPERTGTLPLQGAHWEFLISNDYNQQQRGGHQVNALNHPFSPTPLGSDLFAQFGDEFGLPIVGNFDPPVAPAQTPTPEEVGAVLGTLPLGTQIINGDQWYSFTPLRDGTIMVEATTSTPGTSVTASLYDSGYHSMGLSPASASAQVSVSGSVTAGETYMLRLSGENATADVDITNQVPEQDRLDTSRDGIISAHDVLKVVNELIAVGVHETPLNASNAKMFLDTDLNGLISAHDALQVINYLIGLSPQSASSGSTGSNSSVAPLAAPAVAETGSADVETASADGGVIFALALDSAAAPSATVAPLVADAVFSDFEAAELDSPIEPSVSTPMVGQQALADGASDDELTADGEDLEWGWLG